ncbi:NADH:ubiquinone reductase (Na(+)-transporting) subunit B [Bacteroidales bacterium OttesenSCG-928-B11]|nr:NADH:ubiquinone reductase (Na(+)-transporting) subunit B [Bacteroidales bacterium OttesenSCG-928-C03]MDL2312920.1 NADH:ubiquinone reductase (Na(+)-transporting) subunit B [Bacteroidales bacterium OttesenSCG-928-B11]MDL2326599.1 NADH:ubiquinone reductase (Na(+)-transporting) subunit B [Bacteroidales bacterium OttesenSCG-928-A14]
MKQITNWSDKLGKHFEEGKPLYPFKSLYDAIDTFLLTPKTVTQRGAHIRDAVDMKRILITVMIALLPPLLFGLWNIGLQHYRALGVEATFWQQFGYGFLKWLPLVIVTYVSGLTAEVIFAQWRKEEVSEGFFVTGMLIPMILPPDIPLWIVALGTLFSVIFAKEVFGGTGYNFLNPAIVTRVFIFFAYPSVISGDNVWIAGQPDGISGATPLAEAAMGNLAQMPSIMELCIGTIPGSIGETSKIAILLGAILLVYTGVASFKIMISVVAGGLVTGLLFNIFGEAPLTQIPFYEHILLGGFLFGAVYMATDPVTATQTEKGKIIYGFLIGVLAILIRMINKGYAEGMMLAILFMNIMAPLIDHIVIRLNIRKRQKRAVLVSTQSRQRHEEI